MRVLRPGEGTDNEWRYVQPESGAVFNGFSYWQVKDAVEAHRRAMGYDLSDGWEERFQHDLCKQNEEVLCTDRPAKPRGQRRLTLQDLKRFMLTASKWTGEFVPVEEAERRAAICSTCPKNVTVAGCYGCSGILAMATKFLGKRKTSRDDALQGCDICGCALKVKVHMPVDPDGLEYPEWCWQHVPATT